MALELFGTPLYAAHLQSRAITMENPRGARGAGGTAEGGRKGAPCLPNLRAGQTFVFAEIAGPGVVRHIWMTVQDMTPRKLRDLVLRFTWDDHDAPAVEVPLGDFFGVAHGLTRSHESVFVSTPEGRAFNCRFPMPFRRKARLEIRNDSDEDAGMFFFQVDYTLGDDLPDDTPYFHAQFRRVPQTTMYQDYVILAGVRGCGRFLGAVVGIVDHVPTKTIWWGEGEVKIYLDGDTTNPTICGTGAEDYVGSGLYIARRWGP